ncbi:ubiquinol-cytochrome c reductase iron-sulfur subunit [Mycolicibacterium iranicum]|uniref:Cytochrome bc1 complex Rieske iron-sulfur subunit n=1 Tax=Mycolicibacterium iranicum TaxID=912594 RepID=A0A1X1WA31_MYCIR|nr:Rieske (2Fe-2S) protein [Mycolicibacterium iranicum]ORV83475.1 (2Fe-2S)-binding protein [Mycolicibacterium iranicum]
MSIEVPRKTVLAGAGIGLAAAAVAACSGGSDSSASESPADESSAPESSKPTGEALATTAEVPVGSGVIVGEVVLTQPVAGDYKGFSAVCTHTGCLINEVADGTINCPCHGSKFSLDGAVANGPASKPLEPVAIRVQGDSIVAE